MPVCNSSYNIRPNYRPVTPSRHSLTYPWTCDSSHLLDAAVDKQVIGLYLRMINSAAVGSQSVIDQRTLCSVASTYLGETLRDDWRLLMNRLITCPYAVTHEYTDRVINSGFKRLTARNICAVTLWLALCLLRRMQSTYCINLVKN